ncbi:hypothetical protein BJX64DRAFT_261826 [Aspergillus heterothallicus]
MVQGEEHPADASQQQFTFVGGPVFKKEATHLRSTLLRRALAQKRSQRWQDTTNKLDSILKQQEKSTDFCTGHPPASDEGVDDPSPLHLLPIRGRRVVPVLINKSKNASQRRLLPAQPDRCLACGRLQQQALVLSTASHELQQTSQPRPCILGAHRSNPFLPMDATAAELKVTELLDFAATVIWPHFRPKDYTGNGYRSWAFPMQDKVQLYAVLYASSYHRDVLRIMYGAEDPIIGSKEQLEIRGLALRTLRLEVAKLSESTSSTTCLDGVIMCILYLAVNELHKGQMTRDKSLFIPPFIGLQALDVYGGRIYHPLHWNTMQEIVRRSGGIEKIWTARLTWLLSLSDLFGAFQVIRKPIYPMMAVTGRRLDLDPPGLLFQSYGDTEKPRAFPAPGSAFHELSSLCPPLQQDITSVFIQLGEYSAVVQHLASTKCSDEALDLLGDSRNLIHHRLLSLPDENDPTELVFNDPHAETTLEKNKLVLSQHIYHTCRLSALLYALHVTFPIPRFRATARNILRDLYPRIEWLRARKITRPLLLWCVAIVLSVLGDEGSAESRTLVPYMTTLLKKSDIDSVPKLLLFLVPFAWVDVAAGSDWERLWERILLGRAKEE